VPTREQDVDEAEAAPDDARIAKERAHFFGSCARGYVEVLGTFADQEVTDTAADEVRLVPGAREPTNDLRGRIVDGGLVEFDEDSVGLYRRSGPASRRGRVFVLLDLAEGATTPGRAGSLAPFGSLLGAPECSFLALLPPAFEPTLNVVGSREVTCLLGLFGGHSIARR